MAAKKKKNINLLPSEEFKSSSWGRVLKWVLTTFRVMVIVCEMVVMGAFLSRFWLDAKNSDLNEEINVVKAQVLAYEPVETEFRSLQKKLSIANELYSEQKISAIIDTLGQYLPPDVLLNTVSFVDKSIQIKSSSFSEKSIIQFIVNLESTELFDEITLSQISSGSEDESYITFTIKTKLK
ncbi:PilN domain-containing protein [Candidatus Microgenomates bacterium]|nr:PilN domain-containing protein [Candidatus Microgenomates bacterium]